MIFEDRGIQGEPDESDTEQPDADVAQAAMRHDAEQPEQREALQRPAEGDPFALELDREDEADEKQRGAGLPGQARIARGRDRLAFSSPGISAPTAYGRTKAAGTNPLRRSGNVVRDDFVDQPEMQRPGERADGPRQGLAFFRR